MPPMLCLPNVWKKQAVRVMSALPLCSACCLHVAAGGAGGGAVPAAFCKTLEVAAAQETRRGRGSGGWVGGQLRQTFRSLGGKMSS